MSVDKLHSSWSNKSETLVDWETNSKVLDILMVQTKARKTKEESYPNRFEVPDDKASWGSKFEWYYPGYFEHGDLTKFDCTRSTWWWADPRDISKVDFTKRDSNYGEIKFDEKWYPLNPMGRTGLKSRGMLGKWGPNHSADPIILRETPNGMELLCILRSNWEWAIPWGMIDNFEEPMTAALRELWEEALGKGFDKSIFTKNMTTVYKWWVDDPRNTDNAWMETHAYATILNNEESRSLKLEAGDDAKDVKWMALTEENIESLYASHGELVKKAMVVLGINR